MLTIVIFLFVGLISGVIIAFALNMSSRKDLMQAALGGLLAGLLMSFMLPHG